MSLSGLLQFVGRSLQRLELRLARAAGFESLGECIDCNSMCCSLSLYHYTYIISQLSLI